MNSEIVEKEFINPRHKKRIRTAKWEIIIPEGEPYVIVRPRTDRNGSTHNLLLYATIDALAPHIDAYRADAVSYPGLRVLNIPLTVGKRRIDLITEKGGRLEYWEIKGPREIGEDRTREQLRDYCEHLSEVNLVTAESAIENAKQVIKLSGLQGKVKLWAVRPRLGEANKRSELIYIPTD